MSNRLETAIKASAAEARLTKQKVLKELKQRMEGLIQQIENDRLWISDLKELHNQVAVAPYRDTRWHLLGRDHDPLTGSPFEQKLLGVDKVYLRPQPGVSSQLKPAL